MSAQNHTKEVVGKGILTANEYKYICLNLRIKIAQKTN